MTVMRKALRFLVLALIKSLSRLCFSFSVTWVGEKPADGFRGARLGMLLNHTSLFEPIFLAVLPWHVLWRTATRGVIPGADITLNRPFAGAVYKALAPRVITITRKRDETWSQFLQSIGEDSLIVLAPEGRMKRPTGLDKEGNPMTVRGGIADILAMLPGGKMVLCYSGGLHHVHAPGERFPRLFRRVAVAFEALDIADYKRSLGGTADEKAFKAAVIRDLEARRDRVCATLVDTHAGKG